MEPGPEQKAILAHLVDLIIEGKQLPDYVFSKRFEHYLFFDIDITSSGELIFALKEVAINSSNPLLPAAIFSSASREFLGMAMPDEDWSKKIGGIAHLMETHGDYSSLAIVDSSLRWVAYQVNPVSMGIFAFDGSFRWLDISQDAKDCFADKIRIKNLLISESPRDVTLVNMLGRDYLFNLINNYQ
jgi:hypothetical protein